MGNDRWQGLAELANEFGGLRLLLVVGSRARDTAHPGSDWDLAYLAEPGFDVARFAGEATSVLGTDDVDVVDLARATALFRFEAADAGVRIAGDDDVHEEFRYQAVDFWCDAGPIIRAHYDDVLEGLG